MNGRRDYGLSMAEHGDTRRYVREEKDFTFSLMSILCVFGIAALVTGYLVFGWGLVGAALVVGLINWR
jgi:hypothetical protein